MVINCGGAVEFKYSEKVLSKPSQNESLTFREFTKLN